MTETERAPMTPKEKWTNFWYYNWKYAVLAVIALAVIIAGVVTMCAQPTYYTSVLVGTVQKGVSAESEVIEALGEKLVGYAAGDTKRLPLQMYVIDYPSSEFAQSNMAWDVQLTAELESQESQLYIFDRTMYNRLLDQDAFVDLQAAFPDYDIPMQYAVPLSETPLYSVEIPLPKEGLPEVTDPDEYLAGQRAILDDLYVAFRVDGGKNAGRRAAQWEILENLLAESFR